MGSWWRRGPPAIAHEASGVSLGHPLLNDHGLRLGVLIILADDT
jgi:hypothetical protein